MASTGFTFGGGGLFGAKSTAATPSSSFSFGAPSGGLSLAKTTATSGFSFGTNTSTGSLFGNAPKTASTGLSLFGNTSTSGAGSGIFGATTTSAGTSLFGTVTTSASTGLGLFGSSASSGTSAFKLGGTTTASTSGFTLGGAATGIAPATSSVAAKPENPKEEKVPAELGTLVTDLEKYIKSQKEVKDEISKLSDQDITKCQEEITSLKQVVALVANGIQRDSVAVETLKYEVTQELKHADIAHRAKDIRPVLLNDFVAPMEYFQQLVYSFQNRINSYRLEIEELEIFLSSSSSVHEFTPQDLSAVLKRMSDSFLGLAAQLQSIHEAIKVLKQKYLYFRRMVYNDSSDPFASARRSADSRGKLNPVGPSPFPVRQGAPVPSAPSTGISIGATSTALGSAPQTGISSSFFKPSTGQGLFRSLSFGGSSKSTASVAPTLGSTLFSSNGLNPAGTPGQSTLQLQKPPKGKRGKF